MTIFLYVLYFIVKVRGVKNAGLKNDVLYEWPRSATSPAQSVLTMPNDPPSNSTTCDQGGVSEIASLQNGKIHFFP